jgi:hypothetical protein
MKWQRIVLMLTIISLLALPLAWSQGGNAEQQIKTANNNLITAVLKADTDTLEKLLADDYTGVRGDGSVLTKAQEIEKYKSGAIKYETNEIKDLKIRVYGHTAVSTSLSFSKNIRDGKEHIGTTRNIRVWVKRQGAWKCVAYQTTRVI